MVGILFKRVANYNRDREHNKSKRHIAKCEHMSSWRRQCTRESGEPSMLSCKLSRKKRRQERAKLAFLGYYKGVMVSANMMTFFSFQHKQRIHLLIINIPALDVNKLRKNRSSSTCCDAPTHETLEVEVESCTLILRLVLVKSGARSPATKKR